MAVDDKLGKTGGSAAKTAEPTRREGPEEGYHKTDLSFCYFILDSLPIAILAVDPDLRITRFNPWAQQITGIAEEQALGRYCGEILKGGMCGQNCPLTSVINRQKPVMRLETEIHNKAGDLIPVEMSTAGLFDASGKLIGAVEAFVDISEKKSQEREKANLISMFAHDMNSSLTGIHGLGLRLSKTADLNEENPRKFIDLITREAGKLELLVKDFLEVSRLQTGRLNLTFDATFLDKELFELFNSYEPKAADHGITLRMENKGALPVIEADANRLRRVFANLLDNALKFSPKGTTVTITVEESGAEVMVMVADQGQGIEATELPFIFDIFHRVPDVARKEGYGVGLAIVKAIVEGHGGRVMVTSEVGKGSTFTVFLPKVSKLGDG